LNRPRRGLRSASTCGARYAGSRLLSAVVKTDASGQNPCFKVYGHADQRVSALMTAVSPSTFGGILSSGTTTFSGTRDELIDRLSPASFTYGGWRRFGMENVLNYTPWGTHSDATSLRFTDGWLPLFANSGPSPHLAIKHTPGASAPSIEFHVDDRTGAIQHGNCVFRGKC
jgi:hypothetical protein